MTNTAYAGNSTDVTVEVRGFTASTGLPYTAGAFNTSGLTIQYTRNRGAAVSVTPITQTAAGAHADGGFVHIAAGLYRVDIPDAAVASGADDVVIVVSGVTDVVFTAARVEILGANPRSATVDAAVTSIAANAITATSIATDAITAAKIATDAVTEIANAVVEAEIDALETYNRTSNTAATITGPTNGATTLTITTDATYQPIKSIA